MRIVDLKTFIKLPPNTLHAKYTPCVFDSFCIKMETLEFDDPDSIPDFYVTSDISGAIDAKHSGEYGDLLHISEKTGLSLKMDFETTERDGCFEENQLFAVWEKQDIEMLIERLKKCL